MFLAIDDDGGDLLVHKDEDSGEEGGRDSQEAAVPGIQAAEGVHHPASVVSCGLCVEECSL